MEIFIDGEPFWCAADAFFLVMAQKSIGFEESLFVMAQKSSAIDENFTVMAHPCFDVEEIFFVMALQSDGNAPNRFAIGAIFFVIKRKCLDGEVLFFVISPEGIAGASEERVSGQDVLVMTHGNLATAEAPPIPEPADRAGDNAYREGRLHDLRHLEVLTSGTSRKGGQLRRCA